MKPDKFINNKYLYYALSFLAVAVSLYGLGYRQLSQFWEDSFTWVEREVPARMHFITGPLVLITGLFQFNQNLRRDKPNVHRWIGRVYIFCMLLGIGSIFGIVFHSAYGLVPQISLFILNIIWLISLLIAVYYIAVKKDITSHKYWMIRNYGLTCSAITLRVLLISFMGLGRETAYKIATSNSYIWNMIFAEVIIYRLKQIDKQKSTPPNSVTQVVMSDIVKKDLIEDQKGLNQNISINVQQQN